MCSVTQSCLTLCDPMDCSMPGFSFTITQSLLKLMSVESVMPSNHLVLCHPLFLLPSIFLSIKVFSSESLFASGGQSTRASASASVLPVNIHGWFLLGFTGLISLQSKGLLGNRTGTHTSLSGSPLSTQAGAHLQSAVGKTPLSERIWQPEPKCAHRLPQCHSLGLSPPPEQVTGGTWVRGGVNAPEGQTAKPQVLWAQKASSLPTGWPCPGKAGSVGLCGRRGTGRDAGWPDLATPELGSGARWQSSTSWYVLGENKSGTEQVDLGRPEAEWGSYWKAWWSKPHWEDEI